MIIITKIYIQEKKSQNLFNMGKKENLNLYSKAYDPQNNFYDENYLQLSWYSKQICNNLKNAKNANILSLGIGHKIISSSIVKQIGISLLNYTIIEGSLDIIQNYKRQNEVSDKVLLINDFFENFETDQLYDFIEMGFILEHVDEPEFILKKYKSFLKNDGLMFIAVPNAKSFHRLLGFYANLLDDIHKLGKGDIEFGHKRYYDLESITELIRNAGLKIKTQKGIYYKPFTTDQIKTLKLTQEVSDAMIIVGESIPEYSNAIYIEAVPRN